MKKLFAALALAAVVAPVWAATQTVTLSVPGMTCSTCQQQSNSDPPQQFKSDPLLLGFIH